MMDINLYDWTHDGVKLKLNDMNIIELINFYLENEKEYSRMCILRLRNQDNEEINSECKRLYEEKIIIACRLSDRLAGVENTI